MTKETAVANIVLNIATLRSDINTTAKVDQVRVYANRYYDSACAFTGYSELPDALISFVEDAVLQAWMKRGAEGLNSQSAAGVSTQYLDVEYSLRQNLRYKRNPFSAVAASAATEDNSNA